MARIKKTVDVTTENIRARFKPLLSDVNSDEQKAVKALLVFDHDKWPESLPELLVYGISEIEFVKDYFQDVLTRNGCNLEVVQEEFRKINILIFHLFMEKSFTSLWELLLCKYPYKEDYENVLLIVEIMLTLLVSTAECERGFSYQRRIKSSTRCSLCVETTSDLMIIQYLGPTLELFDPQPAVTRFLQNAARRPAYKSWSENEPLKYVDADNEDDENEYDNSESV